MRLKFEEGEKLLKLLDDAYVNVVLVEVGLEAGFPKPDESLIDIKRVVVGPVEVAPFKLGKFRVLEGG